MRFSLSLFAILVTLMMASCSTSKPAVTATATEVAATSTSGSYAGDWMVTVEDTPLGTTTGTMKLTESAGELSGVFVTDAGSILKLKKITTTDSGMSTSFYFPDYDVDVDVQLKGKPTDAMLIGQSMGQFRTTAKRVK